MAANICIKDLFKNVFKNPQWKKYFILGGIYHFIMIALCIYNEIREDYLVKTNPDTNYFNNPELALIWLVSTIMITAFYGFWLNTIKKNKEELPENFTFGTVNLIKNFFEGLALNIILAFPLIIVIAITTIISLAILIIVAINSPAFGQVAWVFVLFVILVSLLIACIFIVLFNPQFIATYINKKPLAVCNFKNIFRITKQHFKLSFITSLLTIGLMILSLIPFVGFYFEMVWANLYAQYAKEVGLEK